MLKEEYSDTSFGKIFVKVNTHARHIVLRARHDGIYVTVPHGVGEKELFAVIDKYRERLSIVKKKIERKRIDLNYTIDTEYFKLTLVSGSSNKFLAHSELGELRIVCPPDADFDDNNLQEWLYKVIGEALRRNAKIILPPRLYAFSEKYGFFYDSVKINSSKSRWGSCSLQKRINLSYYLVLLPSHLINYVLLHELCHTKEMNHGEKFWKLLNSLTSDKALLFRNELKKYRTDIP